MNHRRRGEHDMTNNNCEREFDFALVIDCVPELTPAVEDAFFEAGCDDATLSIRYGRLYAEFSRSAPALKDAILSAIRDSRDLNDATGAKLKAAVEAYAKTFA